MRPKSSKRQEAPAEQVVKDIRRATRRHFSAEDKIRIVLDGLRGEDSIAELCRKEGIAQSLYYTWSKEFMEAGKRRLGGRHGPCRDHRRGQGSAPRGPRAEGGRRRPDAREPSAQKKHDRGWGRRRMRYPASEKLEIIRIVEQSHLPARRTLDQLGIATPDLLPLVRPLSRRRPGGAGGSALGTEPGVEPHPRRHPGPDHRAGAGAVRAVPARTGRALHRREALLRVGSHGLPAAEGP